MDDKSRILNQLDRILEELAELKKALILSAARDVQRTEQAWKDLEAAIPEVTRLWRGPSAVEEIRDQREKTW